MILALILAAQTALAMPAPGNPAPRPYDLLKCSAAKFGTIWASFGHIRTSDNPEIGYFFSDLVELGPKNELNRAQFMDSRDSNAAGATVAVRPSGITLEFTFNGVKNKVTLIHAVRFDNDSYAGNWEKVSSTSDLADAIYCTAH